MEMEKTVILNDAIPEPVDYAHATHIGTREYQQDSLEAGYGREGIVFGVLCDGMGGLEGGELASRTAVDTFADALRTMDPDADIPDFLLSLIHKANDLIINLSSDGSKNGCGTTLTAAVIAGNSLYWISAGDSRIYIIRKDEILSATRDHSYSLELGEKVAAGIITEEEAVADPQRNALISYLGIDRLTLIDINYSPFVLEPEDIILMCSDGLYRSLSESDIMEILDRHISVSLDECARVLPLYAFDRALGGQDNTSVILLRYLGSN